MRKIIKGIIGVILVEATTSISVFPGQLGRMICETLFRGDNHFSWITDLIFRLYYSGGPVTTELAATIHLANMAAGILIAMLLIGVFIMGIGMILSSFGIDCFRNNRGSA